MAALLRFKVWEDKKVLYFHHEAFSKVEEMSVYSDNWNTWLLFYLDPHEDHKNIFIQENGSWIMKRVQYEGSWNGFKFPEKEFYVRVEKVLKV